MHRGYRILKFQGNVRRWTDTILHSGDHLLLCSPAQDAPPLHPEITDGKNDRKIGLFTSGSTDAAKCIWNSMDRLLFNARITAREFDISTGDRLLMMAKPWHVAGISWMLMAETLNIEYRFIPTEKGEQQRWLKAIRVFRPDCLLTVPQVLRSLSGAVWKVPKIVYGGAPVRKEDYPHFAKHGEELWQGYGQTEAGGLISCHHVDSDKNQPGNIHECYGQWPEEFAIRCEGNPERPAQIWLKSPTACRNEFYDTGDIGYITNQQLYLAGRGNA